MRQATSKLKMTTRFGLQLPMRLFKALLFLLLFGVFFVLATFMTSLLVVLNSETDFVSFLDKTLLSTSPVNYNSSSLLPFLLLYFVPEFCQNYHVVRSHARFESVSKLDCSSVQEQYYTYPSMKSQCHFTLSGLEAYAEPILSSSEESTVFPTLSLKEIVLDFRTTGIRVDVVNVTISDVKIFVVYEDLLLTKERTLRPFVELIPPPPTEESFPKLGMVDVNAAALSVHYFPQTIDVSDLGQQQQGKLLTEITISDDLLSLVRRATIDAGEGGTDQMYIPDLVHKVLELGFNRVFGDDRVEAFGNFLQDADGKIQSFKSTCLQMLDKWNKTATELIGEEFLEFTGELIKKKLKDAEEWRSEALRELDTHMTKFGTGVVTGWENILETWEKAAQEILENGHVENVSRIIHDKLQEADRWKGDVFKDLESHILHHKSNLERGWDEKIHSLKHDHVPLLKKSVKEWITLKKTLDIEKEDRLGTGEESV
mmetsp:Transcript_17722/g.27572  ORF Transcript_17722/g.27572 Transcript_17722/m.27572 type:complete len:485 (-) Transcript_17722:187-1641(-)